MGWKNPSDGTQTGVKGLVDSGITEIPSIFRTPQVTPTNTKPPSTISQLKIPTIDLNDHRRRNVVEKIGEAAENLGFFQVINHGIPMDVLERMIEGTRGFHEQDSEVKKRFYSRDHETRNLVYYSTFDLYNSKAANWRDTLTCYLAPDPPRSEDLPEVCGEIMMEYSKEMMSLGELLFELLSEALGLNPNHLKEMDCAKSQMASFLYYPPCPQPDLTIGLSKHTDVSFLTILLQDNIGGLQILHDHQHWIDVPPVPGALIINIGDFLQLITNDKFISVEHRVIAHGSSKPRISMACFFTTFLKVNPRVYGPIKELLSEDNLPKYRDLSINEFVDVYKSKEISIPTLHHFRI